MYGNLIDNCECQTCDEKIEIELKFSEKSFNAKVKEC